MRSSEGRDLAQRADDVYQQPVSLHFFTEQSLRGAADQLKVPLTLIRVETAMQAQQSPCPYGLMGIFMDGPLLSCLPIGATELIEIVVVEVCIAGIKRCLVVKDELRNTKAGFSD